MAKKMLINKHPGYLDINLSNKLLQKYSYLSLDFWNAALSYTQSVLFSYYRKCCMKKENKSEESG